MTATPILLLAGGPGSDPAATGRLLASTLAATGKPAPAVAYIGAASGDHAGFMARMASLLRGAGAGHVKLAPLAGRHASPAAARHVIEQADLIYVSGGDVEEGMAVLSRADMLPVLREQYAAGKPFVGVSAGSIMLGKRWVRWRNPEDDASAETFACLGLAPVLCDTHAEDDDWVELRALLQLEGEGAAGYGIGSGCALRVWPGGDCEAAGDGVVRLVCKDGHVAMAGCNR